MSTGILRSITELYGKISTGVINLFIYVKDIFKKPEYTREKSDLNDFIFLLRFIRPVWKLALLSLVLTAIGAALNSIFPLTTKIFIDYVIMKQGPDQIEEILSTGNLQQYAPEVANALQSVTVVILLIVALTGFKVILEIVQRYVNIRYDQELTFNVQKSLFDHVLRVPLSFFKDNQTGYLVSRVTDDVRTLQYLISGVTSSIISSLFTLFFSIAVLITINLKMSLIILLFIPVYIAVNYFFSGRIRSISNSMWESNAEVSRDIQEIFSGVEVVKSHATEERELEKVTKKIRAYMQATIKSTIISSASGYIMSGTQLFITLAIMWFGAGEIQSGRMTIGDYVVFMAYTLSLTGTANSLFYSYTSIQPTLASLDRLMEIFKIIPEYDRDQKGKKLVVPEKITGEIRYENVSFSYEVNKPVLTNINFTARHGETIALVGPSGAGKTTLVNLLLKFYTPQSGRIYLDGNDLNDIDPAWLRKQISIVSQDIFLFDDTIENNIKYGRPSATREEVIQAAKLARIDDAIMQMPDGYDTKVGERGTKLSVGQRQRVSIARAFLKNAPMLIFDEPTSALDVETERAIKESLKELVKGRTVFIISHHETMIDIATTVIQIKTCK